MSRAIAVAKLSIKSVVAAGLQLTRQSKKQRRLKTDWRSASIKALAKTTASVNDHFARLPRLILIDAPFSSRVALYGDASFGVTGEVVPLFDAVV